MGYEEFINKANIVLMLFGNEKLDGRRIVEILNAPIGRYVMGQSICMEVEQKVVNIFAAYNTHKDEKFTRLYPSRLRDINLELAYGIWEHAGEICEYDLPLADGIIRPADSFDTMGDDLYRLLSLSNLEDRAVAYFCYIIDKCPFHQCNIETAFVCMDRMLMEAGAKFAASDQEIKILLDKIQDSWETKNITDLYKYIHGSLICRQR